MIKKTLLLAVIVTFSCAIAFAQGTKKDDSRITRTKVMNEVQGEIISLSKRGISILFNRDEANGSEDEIYIPINKKDIRFDHIKDLSELALGDIVRVQFEEEDVAGQGKDEINFQAKLISFVKKGAPKKAQPEQKEEPAGLGVLDSVDSAE
jgi:hypothetical protein